MHAAGVRWRSLFPAGARAAQHYPLGWMYLHEWYQGRGQGL